MPRPQWNHVVKKLLGLTPTDAAYRKGTIKLHVIRDHLIQTVITDDSSELEQVQYARYILMLMLGCVLFPNDQQNRVDLYYLHPLEHEEHISGYSWGVAVLAYLYRHLCHASQTNARGICGPLQLLMMWVYTHITTLCPINTGPRNIVHPAHVDAFHPPYGAWVVHMNSFMDTVAHTLRPTRDVLDRLRIEEFVWLRYTDDSPEMAEWHSGMELGRACVPLIWYHIVENQYPDRVIRQFGLVQTYPPRDPIRVQVHLHALHCRRNSTMNWRQRHSAFVAQWDSRGEHMVQMGVQYLGPGRRVQLGDFECNMLGPMCYCLIPIVVRVKVIIHLSRSIVIMRTMSVGNRKMLLGRIQTWFVTSRRMNHPHIEAIPYHIEESTPFVRCLDRSIRR